MTPTSQKTVTGACLLCSNLTKLLHALNILRNYCAHLIFISFPLDTGYIQRKSISQNIRPRPTPFCTTPHHTTPRCCCTHRFFYGHRSHFCVFNWPALFFVRCTAFAQFKVTTRKDFAQERIHYFLTRFGSKKKN